MLMQEDVAHSAIPISGFTRESLAVEECETGKQFRFILPGPEISKRDQGRCLERFSMLAADLSITHI
jgi:6-phosphofructokinase 2